MKKNNESVASAYESLESRRKVSELQEQQKRALVQKAYDVRDSGTWTHKGLRFQYDNTTEGGHGVPHTYTGTKFIPIHTKGVEVAVRELSGRDDSTITHLLVRKKEGDENQYNGSALASFYPDGGLEVDEIKYVDNFVLKEIDSLLTFIDESPDK